MSAVNLSEFQPYIGTKVPGAGMLAIVQEVRNALIEFCARSRVWRITHPDIAVTSAAHTYDLAPLPGAVVAEIIKPFWDGNEIIPSQQEDLDLLAPGWETATAPDPLYVYQPIPTQVRVVPALDTGESGTLSLRVSLKPKRTADTIEEWLFDEYFEAIGWGAVARLRDYRGEPYADPGGAAEARQKFLAGADAARARSEAGGGGRMLIARTLPFG